MMICSSKLTTCKVVGNGEAVILGLQDFRSAPVSVQLPFEQAASVVMTLPQLLAQALTKRTGNRNSRYVFRVSHLFLEGSSNQDCLILTWKTVDGFEVSLGIPIESCGALGASLHHEG